MSTSPTATTNKRLNEALAIVEELISWAEADAQHARENDAPDTARDDMRRVKNLQRARGLLITCERY